MPNSKNPKTKQSFTMLAKRFAQNLKEVRETLGVTQLELAERMGAERSYVSDLERGRHSSTLWQVERVASALNVDPEVLLQNPDKRRKPSRKRKSA